MAGKGDEAMGEEMMMASLMLLPTAVAKWRAALPAAWPGVCPSPVLTPELARLGAKAFNTAAREGKKKASLFLCSLLAGPRCGSDGVPQSMEESLEEIRHGDPRDEDLRTPAKWWACLTDEDKRHLRALLCGSFAALSAPPSTADFTRSGAAASGESARGGRVGAGRGRGAVTKSVRGRGAGRRGRGAGRKGRGRGRRGGR